MLEHRLSRCCAFSISFARFGCGDNYGRSFVSLQQKTKAKKKDKELRCMQPPHHIRPGASQTSQIFFLSYTTFVAALFYSALMARKRHSVTPCFYYSDAQGASLLRFAFEVVNRSFSVVMHSILNWFISRFAFFLASFLFQPLARRALVMSVTASFDFPISPARISLSVFSFTVIIPRRIREP